MVWIATVLILVLSTQRCTGALQFPLGFKFGAATAAYQVEGAWNVSDKGESVWDRLIHTNPAAIADVSNGDVACDSYHQWERDIDLAEELGLHFYRFSISWPRLLPTGFPNIVSEDGKNYYNNLIDGLLEKGIEPMVTLYHWDLPQRLQDLGEVSIANQLLWFEPMTEDDADIAELANENCAGRYSHPIYSKEGGWPPSIEKVMEENSRKRGYSQSTLPAFTQEEIELIKGSYDFYAMNHYTSRVIRKAKEGEKFRPWPAGDAEDLNGITGKRPEWKGTPSFWFHVNPNGIRQQLKWLKSHYGNLRIMITENGVSTLGGLDDQDRVEYYRSYLEQVLLAINEDGVNVTHYTAWTLIDNFEWMDGYKSKFGLYEVDFNDPLRKRTARQSAEFYKNVIKQHALPDKKRATDEL